MVRNVKEVWRVKMLLNKSSVETEYHSAEWFITENWHVAAELRFSIEHHIHRQLSDEFTL